MQSSVNAFVEMENPNEEKIEIFYGTKQFEIVFENDLTKRDSINAINMLKILVHEGPIKAIDILVWR